MEEELNDDLEERLYALIHHVDESQANAVPSHDASLHVVEAPRSTVRRYWRTNYNPYQKTNTPKDPTPTTKNTPKDPTPTTKNTPKDPTPTNKNTPTAANKTTPALQTNETVPKEENGAPESPPPDLISILKNTVPHNYEKTVEIVDIDDQPNIVELETSDEDEVIEVKLPPKPTITIESSDDDEPICKPVKPVNDNSKKNASKENKSPNNINRDVSASPVPSVMSSMSDEFIRGDCIALNISSAQPDNESFDFSLHGSDLLGDGTPSKKKKKKRSKDRLTSTPIAADVPLAPKQLDNIFATPKSKAKNKKQKAKSYVVSEKSIPNADVYDSDSNQSVIDVNKHPDVYNAVEKSIVNPDIYESDSSVAENAKGNTVISTQQSKRIDIDSSDSNASLDVAPNKNLKSVSGQTQIDNTLVDLTDDTVQQTDIEENIVFGNVSGFQESEDYEDENLTNPSRVNSQELGKFCSTKVPQILNEDLDFDNLKGKDKVCRRRRYSLTTLRAEMEKFYNESWGGENFNHQEILKHMPRDKSLWVIDPKDRMPNPPKRRVTCNVCNRVGHRDDTCRLKPPVCYMCGNTGHYEPRCPRKICVNCGSPNFVYSTMCRNCASWGRQSCAECSQPGHPASHCPDVWRRYHNTIDENMPLEKTPGPKPQHQLFCSGCARRGHLVHTCRAFVPFCPLPIPSPGVARYWRLYPPTTPTTPTQKQKPQDDTVSSMHQQTHTNKRVSKSPVVHETHVNKKRMTSEGDSNKNQPAPRKISLSKEPDDAPKQTDVSTNSVEETLTKEVEKALDYIPISSNNHDQRGQIIQDNEVSDTSEVLTSARIYVTNDVIERLQTTEGQDWLKHCMDKLQVDVQRSFEQSFLTIKGTVSGQEAFQSELREWTKGDSNRDPTITADPADAHKETGGEQLAFLVPKKKNDVLRTLSNAFDSLKHDIGDPKKMYKELLYLQNNHQTLVHQKMVSPGKLKNNRHHINLMTKKLNMILLGQAGLGEGSKHMSALYSLQEKVINFRQQKVSKPLREAISSHYRHIFTGTPRDDYVELLRMFHSSKRRATFKNNKKNNSLKLKTKKKRNFKNNPLQEKPFPSSEKPIDVDIAENNAVPVMPALPRKALPDKALINKMMFYKKRLLNASAKDKARNYQRLELVNRLQNHIARLSLSGKDGANKSARKKMKKTQEQAQVFLADV